MNEPLISVIVPIYNMEKHLGKCVDSIVNQTYKNLEIILVDDGSIDRSPQLCDEYAKIDDRVKVIHKNNGGLSSARNAGLSICHGSYVGFVDSDDYIETVMYESLISVIGSNPRTIAVTAIAWENEDGNILHLENMNKQFETKEQYLESLLLHTGDVSACSKLFSRDIINNCRFDECKLNEDLLFVFDIENNFDSLVYTNVIGYHYVCHKGSTSRSFGKAVHDMVDNSKEVRKYVEIHYPQLSEQAERLEIYQNIAFLWSVPVDYERKNDPLCKSTLSFIRRNLWAGLRNRFLTGKAKVRLVLLTVMPRVAPKVYGMLLSFPRKSVIINKRGS